jgi:hypothetical protein
MLRALFPQCSFDSEFVGGWASRASRLRVTLSLLKGDFGERDRGATLRHAQGDKGGSG